FLLVFPIYEGGSNINWNLYLEALYSLISLSMLFLLNHLFSVPKVLFQFDFIFSNFLTNSNEFSICRLSKLQWNLTVTKSMRIRISFVKYKVVMIMIVKSRFLNVFSGYMS
ncbi:hypothetical protein L9F63_018038, partial [Diploptera punctata]